MKLLRDDIIRECTIAHYNAHFGRLENNPAIPFNDLPTYHTERLEGSMKIALDKLTELMEDVEV